MIDNQVMSHPSVPRAKRFGTLNMTSLEFIVLYYASINYHNKQLLAKVQL